MRTRRVLLLVGAASALLLLAATGWVAGTEAGLRFLVARAGTLAPGTLDVGGVQGRLVGPLVLGDVRWARDAEEITARRVELDWRPWALLQREIRFDRLHLEGIVVDLPAPDSADAATPAPVPEWREFALPWGVFVEDLQVDGARLLRDGVLRGEITALDGALRARDRSLSLQGLEFSGPQGAARGDLSASTDPLEPWSVDLAWEINLPDLAAAGQTRITGRLPELVVHQQLSAPAMADVSGRVQGLPGAPAWDLRIELQPLPAGSGPWPGALDGAVANVDVSGSLEDMHIRGDVTVPAVLESSAALDATLGWRESALVLDAVGIDLGTGARLDAQGKIVPGQTPEVQLRGTAAGITWPLDGRETLATLPLLEFEGGSTGTDWRVAAQAEVTAPDAPAARVDLRARGDTAALQVDALEIRTLGGKVTGTGSVRWQEQPAADFRLQVAGVNPARMAPAWPGRVGGKLHLHGWYGPGHRVQINASDISGELRSQPLTGTLRLSLGEDTLDITEAALALGSASLEASGSVAHGQVALRARLDAPRLEELGPHITGRITAQARIEGPRSAPVIELSAEGGRLSWGELRARVLQADADVDLSGDNPSTVQAELVGISARPGRSTTLRLQASGRPADHTVQIEFTRRRPDQSLSMALRGELGEAHWRGQLSDVSVIESQQLLWQLQAPADLALSADELQLQQACMDGVFGTLCLNARRRGARGWLGAAELARLDLGPLSEWLGLGLTARGAVSGTARLVAADERFLELEGGFGLSKGDISRRDRRSETLLSWTEGRLDLAGDTTAAEATLRLALPDSNLLQGRLRVGWNEADPSLDGNLEARLDRLALITELVPELSALGGELGVRVNLAGTLAAPAPSGSFEWRDGSAAIPELGLAPKDIQLHADISEGRLTFRSTGTSGEGRFEADGEFDLRAAGVNGQASLQGKNLTVARLPDAMVVADPELRFRFREDRLNIGGRVHIPDALISGVGTSGAVRPSPDEVVVGPRAPTTAESGIVVSSRIEVSAGPAVKLQIGGFSGRVEGSVLTVVQPETEPWGRGELRVVDGEMTVLGQTLEIETGRLIYDGGPLENPSLEVRAVRRVRDVTAGALVRGTIQQPQVSIFSEPPMSNAEALSYLTLGKSLEQIQSGERQTVNQAANALALSGGGLVVQDLARRLGFEDLEVSAETGDDGSALVVSKYLGSGLYVSYGLGLFDTVNTLRLRYQFNRRLSLEAESGEEASADLFYSFERN